MVEWLIGFVLFVAGLVVGTAGTCVGVVCGFLLARLLADVKRWGGGP